MNNHKWKNNICVNCGISRVKKKWSLLMAIVNHPPWDVYKYGSDWWYGDKDGFKRPDCKKKIK